MPRINHLTTAKSYKQLIPNLKKIIFRFQKITLRYTKINHLYYFVILFALFIRIKNINYNSPFSDEAIYVVIGKLGVFQGDWWSYNASSWMGGSPFFYPTISAISYITGGITSSRFINVVFGVLTVETILRITSLINKQRVFSGIISGLIMAASATAVYVSRLATYDMPSYYFAVMGLYLLLLAERKKSKSGKYYFLSSIFVIFAALTKIITVIYLPIILIYSFLSARSISKKQRVHNNNLFFWTRYFIPPLAIGLLIYFITYFASTVAFFNIQFDREKVGYFEVLSTFAKYLAPALALFTIASVGLIIKRMWKLWMSIIFLSSIPLLFHLASNRLISLDKHVFMSLIFISIGIGIGLDKLYSIKQPLFNRIKHVAMLLILIAFIAISYKNAANYNKLWPNSENVLQYIESKVKSEDLILAENGPEVILATYDTNFPLNTTTFDYFEYKKSTELEAYKKAVLDGYFNMIEVEINDESKTDRFKKISSLIAEEVNENYTLAYSDEGYAVYLRRY